MYSRTEEQTLRQELGAYWQTQTSRPSLLARWFCACLGADWVEAGGSGPTPGRGAAAPNRHRWLLLPTRHRHPQLPEKCRGQLKGGNSLVKGQFFLPQHDASAGAPLHNTVL